MSYYKIKQHVRLVLNENYNRMMSDNRIIQINTHLDEEFESFINEFKKLSLENNHPYIKHYLNLALLEKKNDIKIGQYQSLGLDELLL